MWHCGACNSLWIVIVARTSGVQHAVSAIVARTSGVQRAVSAIVCYHYPKCVIVVQETIPLGITGENFEVCEGKRRVMNRPEAIDQA